MANKQDRLRRKLRGVDDSLAAFSEFAPLLPQGPDQLDGSTPLTLVQVSATSAVSASSNGGLDVELFNAFFRGLLDRSRGSAPSMLSSLGMRRTTGSSLPAVIAVAGGDSSCSLADRRLDEDYV